MLLLGDTYCQHWYTHAHITPSTPPPAPHRTPPQHRTQPLLSHADCSAWFTSSHWPTPPRGQVHCQSGWHIVFHSSNQQTAPWWVSTLVVKVTFDGWEGYGSECWEILAGSSFPSSQRWSRRKLLYLENRDWLIILEKEPQFLRLVTILTISLAESAGDINACHGVEGLHLSLIIH